MVPSSLRRALAVAVLAGLTLGACSESSSPTAAEYVGVADEFCKSVDDRLADIEKDYDVATYEAAATGENNPNVDRPERWFRSKIIPQYQSMLDGLRGIQPPEDDIAYLTDLYQDLDLRIQDLNLRPSEGRDFIRQDELLRNRFESYGMEVCGTV